MVPIRVLWADESVLAVLKPAGMPVQADPTGDPDLLSITRTQQREPTLQITHRLDRPVSGVVLFARSPQATAHLNEQFRLRLVHKVYWAIVEGHVPGVKVVEGVVEHDPRTRKAMVSEVHEQAVVAKLKITPITLGDRYTLVEVQPSGGAFHQIRAQLSRAGWPIKGDVKYGARRGEKDRSIALHARSIAFRTLHAEDVSVVAPAPGTAIWNALLGSLRP
ncbi:MAG TPA: RNA pseudouridine synthase [Flavobacteriales bacterium]|nr:RNA pseudouridine synthase [Flavobacteriales bacterium]